MSEVPLLRSAFSVLGFQAQGLGIRAKGLGFGV